MDILVAKKKKGGIRMKVVKKGKDDVQYEKIIDIKNPVHWASLLDDCEILFDAPIKKAIFIKNSRNSGPFW